MAHLVNEPADRLRMHAAEERALELSANGLAGLFRRDSPDASAISRPRVDRPPIRPRAVVGEEGKDAVCVVAEHRLEEAGRPSCWSRTSRFLALAGLSCHAAWNQDQRHS